MMTSISRFALALVVALSTTPVMAEHEGPEAHAKGVTKTIVLDSTDIRPDSITLAQGDVLSFLNSSTHLLAVTFIEPKDVEQRIRCGLVHGKKDKPAAPWALFTWDDGKLAATIPPGQFASVCAFAPGKYAFTSEQIGHQGRNPGTGIVPAKATIVVQ